MGKRNEGVRYRTYVAVDPPQGVHHVQKAETDVEPTSVGGMEISEMILFGANA